jgi:hypothetical protein
MKRLTRPQALSTGNLAPGADVVPMRPKKVRAEWNVDVAKNQLIQADTHICAARSAGHRKARNSAISWPFGVAPSTTARRMSSAKGGKKTLLGPEPPALT